MSVPVAQHGEPRRDESQPKAFFSYRRSDCPTAALALARAFGAHFGVDRVFLDVDDLELGSRWPEQLDERVWHADVVIAVIGPRWVGLADARGRRAAVNPAEEDVLRHELDTAVRAGALIVPVLVEGASLPGRERLPRAFRALAALPYMTVRPDAWDRDVEALIASVRKRVAAPRVEPPRPAPVESGKDMPGAGHFSQLVEYLAPDELLVPVLGSGAHDAAPWQPGSGRTPERRELAIALADRFGLPREGAELARIAQHIVSTRSALDLHHALGRLLSQDGCAPGPAHRFLARIPSRLRARGTEGYQVILTASYDSSLERAFDEAGEPFDVAVFLAEGRHVGKFLHIPWWDEGSDAIVVDVPNEYLGFPFGAFGELERTVIVKIHGGVLHDARPDLLKAYEHNFVITEDDYIGYLSREPVENLIPTQLLGRLRNSHFLFLGYGVRDWSLRVFLRRIWDDRSHGWAVESHSDAVDQGFWKRLAVERLDVPLSTYLREFERHLEP